MNERNDAFEQKIDRILFYLESDKTTGHIGIAEQTQINTSEIRKIIETDKVRMGKIGAVGVVFGVLGSLAFRVLGYLKLVI